MRTTLLLIVGLGACGGGGGNSETPDAAPDAPDITAFHTLVMSTWSLQPGTEVYQCATVTVPRDMYISELRPIIPVGTHHTVVSLGAATKPDNPGYVCSDPFEFGGRFIYGTGVGSKPFVYPTGIALKLTAGQQVHLNLHLYNTGDSVLSGTSGVEIRETTMSAVQNIARMDITGTSLLNIPPGVSTQTGNCTIGGDVNLVSFQPHMHQLGTHLKYTVTPAAAGAYVLYDQNYTFDGQEHVMLSPIRSLKAGDQLKIECTYNNTTAGTVSFGESSNDEMCFAGVTIYPYTASLCTQ